MRAQLSLVLSQITRLTDRQTEFSSLDRVCIPCSEVKIAQFYMFKQLPISDSSTLAPFPSYGWLLVKWNVRYSGRELPHFNALAGGDPLRISP